MTRSHTRRLRPLILLVGLAALAACERKIIPIASSPAPSAGAVS
jgi:hypothetical protein